MIKTVLIALGAGLATALLFWSLLTGTPIAFSLFLLTPVPVAIAGLGWGPLCAALAAVTASLVVAVAGMPLTGLELFLRFAAPAAWLTYLAGLWRDDPERPGERQWYPLGRILLNAIAVAAVSVILMGFIGGFDPNQVTAQLTQSIHQLLVDAYGSDNAPAAAELEPLVRLNVGVLPYFVAALDLIMLVLALWLAGRITRTSGRLARPWIPLWTVELPGAVAAVFAGALVLTLLPGAIGLAAATVAGATGCGMVLLGLAVLHAVTRGKGGRFALLALTYGVTFLLILPSFVLALIGMTEATAGIRNRFPNRPTV